MPGGHLARAVARCAADRSWTGLLAGFALGAAGCSFVNAIDVCDRQRPPEHAVNARVEGRQRAQSDRAVVAMPIGGALVAFSSAVSADPSDGLRFEIRGTLLGVDGAPQPTGGAANELTYAPADGAPGSLDFRSQASIAPPDREDGHGVIVYAHSEESSSQVVALFIRGSGAPLGPDLESARMDVSTEEPPTCEALRDPTQASNCVTDPVAVALGPTRASPESTRDFALFWTASRSVPGSVSTSVRARLVRARFGFQVALTSRLGTVAEPVDLVTGSVVQAITALALSEGRILLVWQERDASDVILTRARLLDDRLLQVGDDDWALGRSDHGAPSVTRIAAAYDGHRVLVAWTERGAADVDRVVFRLVDERGARLDDGEARVLAPSAGAQASPSVTVLRSRRPGFAVAWESEGDPTHDDTSGSGIRMIVLDESGEPLFASLACAARDFQLDDELEGDQTRPALTTLIDGTVVAVWTGIDISETGVRSVALRAHDLLPLPREANP